MNDLRTPSLFAAEPAPARPRPAKSSAAASSAAASWITAHCDGGARGNPGPAGYGAEITNSDGTILAELSEFLGIRTNNYAEYSGLLASLEYALAHGHPQLRVVSDSELMVKQIQGKYKVNSPDLKPLWQEAKHRIARLERFEISHALRHKNKAADRLANEAMDRGMSRGPTPDRGTSRGPTPDRGTSPGPTPDRGMSPGPTPDRGMSQGPTPDRGMSQGPTRGQGSRDASAASRQSFDRAREESGVGESASVHALAYPSRTAAPPPPRSFDPRPAAASSSSAASTRSGSSDVAAPLASAPRPSPAEVALPDRTLDSPAPAMLRGFTRDGVIHILGKSTLPDGRFVKIIPE